MFVSKIVLSKPFKPSFERRLTKEEEIGYKKEAIEPALKYLGTEEVAMIVHGSCFPENKTKDLGCGSPYGNAALQMIPFKKLHGFNSDQLGPVGVIRDANNYSPYDSTISTRNYLFIDFEQLKSDDYANILSDKDLDIGLKETVPTKENYTYTNFPEAFANSKYLLKTANNNLKKQLLLGNLDAINLNKEFEEFKSKKGDVVYKDALFDVLAEQYKTVDFRKWDDEDKNLIQNLSKNDEAAKKRYKKIVNRAKDDYEAYILGQFIIDKQIKENTKVRKDFGYKYINDLLVGFSKSDEWANQELFLKDYEMGCPFGGPNGPQTWSIPVLDPKKFFNSDSELGPSGLYLKKKLEDALENFDNVRIDHALGLVDPYIYDRNTVEVVNNEGRLNLEKFRGDNISNIQGLDPDGNYKKVLDRIILPTLAEHGLDKNSPVWEDLVAETKIFNEVYHNQNNLPGISQLEYKRGESVKDKPNWGLIGSHDSIPAIQMVKGWQKQADAWNPLYLAGFLNSNPKRAAERDEFCNRIVNDDRERIKAKFAELFLTCKKIQISFADFFGIDKVYNLGGSKKSSNWKLRLNSNYEDSYYDNLASENPTALNMPEILKIAVQAKSDMDNIKLAKENELSDIPAQNPPEVQQIINNLDKYEKILKE